MAISKAKKEKIYSQLLEGFKGASGVSFTKNNGLTVQDISNLRSDLRKTGARMMLAKKTIIKLAFKEAYGKELTDEMLDGQIAIVFADGDDAIAPLGAISKNMQDLNTKTGDKIIFVGAYLDGVIQDASTTTKLASLPSRDVLLAKLLGSLMSPISGLARFFDGAKTKLEDISGKTVADLIGAAEASASAPKEETPSASVEETKTPEAATQEPAETPVEVAPETTEPPAETATNEPKEEVSEAPALETSLPAGKAKAEEAPVDTSAEEKKTEQDSESDPNN